MATKARAIRALTIVLIPLSTTCCTIAEPYGYAGDGDAGIVHSIRSNYMNQPGSIEQSLRAELYRYRASSELLTREYLTARGAICVDHPVQKCRFRGEIRMRHTSTHLSSERAANPYQRVYMAIDIHLTDRPQKSAAIKTETWSSAPLHSFLPRP